MDKKAQVTLFIVIGLIILALVGTFMYIREKSVEGEIGKIDISEVPMEFRPVYNFINDIVYDVAVEGLEIMGLQGGWISVDDAELSGETFMIHPDATSSEILKLFNIQVPYWYFMSSPNECMANCEFSTKGKAPLNSWTENPSDRQDTDKSVEAQLDRYIEANLKERLALEFNTLRKQGYDISGEGDVLITTIVGEEDISVSVSYKIIVEKEDGKGEFDRFFVRVPLNLKKMYALAEEIINAEVDYHFLDEIFWNWISIYQGLEGELPPTTQFDVSVTSAGPWFMTTSRKFIEDSILVPFVKTIQIQDTQNYESKEVPGDPNDNFYRAMNGIRSMAEPKFLSKPYNMSVVFIYQPEWSIYFNIDPHNGEVIRSTQYDNNILGMLPISFQNYKFFYDVSIPVLVIITSDDELKEEGYSLMFAIESNIRGNKPLSPAKVVSSIVGTQRNTLFTDESQWLSGNITIEIIDNFGAPVEGIFVRYLCGTQVADIGVTTIDEEEKASLISKFPLCENGLLNLHKEGYLGFEGIRLSTKLGEEAYILVQT